MNRRRTAVAVLLGSAAAFLATACGPSDSGSSASAGTPPTAASATPSTPAAAQGGSGAADAAVPGTAPTRAPAAAPTRAPAAAPTAAPGSVPAAKNPPKGSSPIRTTKLADGSTAEVYKVGDTHYYAKVMAHGSLFVSLETTNGHVDGIDANDMFIVLDLDGTIHSWIGGSVQGPGTFTIAGGWTAKITKVGEDHYRAQLSGGEGTVATLDAKAGDEGRSAGVNANGVYVVLGNDGQISAHL